MSKKLKIVADVPVRQYEFTYLTPDSLTTDEAKAVKEAVAKLVKKAKGTVVSEEDWGKKELAYTIVKAGKRHNTAIYTHMVLEVPAHNVQAFEKEIFLQEFIMRHLLVVAEKPKKEQAEKQSE